MHCWPIHFNIDFNLQFECNIMDILSVLVAIAGVVLAICQFRKQNMLNRKTTIDQNNKNWYLTALVIPYLDRINVFFDGLVASVKELKSGMDNTDLFLRAKEQGNYNEQISAFFSPIEATMSSYDQDLCESISTLGLSLQDEVTNIISDANVTPADIERRIMRIKGALIGVLYKPIQGESGKE